jgi:hypothetical protein
MNKYDSLKRYLAALDQPSVTLSFKELEQSAKLKLPYSAKLYRQWWGNETNKKRAQARAWLDAGYFVESVVLPAGPVCFKQYPNR